MNQHQFLQRILPPLPAPDPFGNAPVYFALGLEDMQPKPRPVQIPCSSIQSVIDNCNSFSASGFDSYMAICSFKDVLQGRKQINAHEAKSIWADIDAGKPGGKYATAVEALQDLDRFVNETGLMPSLGVLSGKGVHVYWTFDKAIPVAQWMQIAGLFYQLCTQRGLAVDPTRAVDSASVLRLPGTIHSKTGNIVTAFSDSGFDWNPKAFVQQIAKTIDPNAPMVPLSTKAVVKANIPNLPPINPGIANLMGMGPQAPTADAEIIAKNCHQILSMGVGQYPQWFAGMSVLRRCVNGLEWAHKLSKLDPSRYDEQATEAKFYMAAEDAPALCSTFEMINPQMCSRCRFKGMVKTPAQVSRMGTKDPLPIASAQPVVIVQPVQSGPVCDADSAMGLIVGHRARLNIPDKWEYQYVPIVNNNFKVDHRGIIWVRSEKDPTAPGGYRVSEEVICRSQLYYKHSVLSVEDMRPQRSHIFEAIHPNGRKEELRFVIDEDMSQQNIMKWFSNGNLHPMSGAYTGQVFMSFMNAYLTSVTHQSQELFTYDLFGWNKFVDPATKQEKIGFVTGAGMVSDTGIHDIAYSGKSRAWAKKSFTHKGTLEQWKFVPQMYTTLGQRIGELAVCFAFSAALMPYGAGEAKNCLLNIWSGKSGLGKTQVLRAAASVWGDPYKSFFTKDESIVARARRLTVWNNIPAMMDELTDMPDEQMSNLAFLLINGNEKSKLKSSGAEFVETGDWSTCTFATANKSFKAALAKAHGDTDATLQRVMEYECEFESYSHLPEVQAYIDECITICQNNFGLAGPEFIFQLLQHPERLVTLTKRVEQWVRVNGFRNDERFMSHALGLAIQCGRWAVEFGILDYDMDALEHWVINVFVPHNRQSTREWAPNFTDNLSVYINDRAGTNTVVVTAEERTPDQIDPRVMGIPDKYVVVRPMRDTVMRFCQAERTLYLSKSDFNAWCNSRKVAGHSMIKRLNAEGFNIVEVHVNLGKNISWMPTSRMRCYKIEAADVDKLGFDMSSIPVQPAQIVNNDPVQNLLMK